MAFAGGLGMDITGLGGVADRHADVVALFSESTSRFVVEVRPQDAEAFARCLGDGVPLARIGVTCPEPRLRVAGASGAWVVWAELAALKEAWQRPLAHS